MQAEDTQFSNYAKINLSSLQKQSTASSSLFAVDDNIVEYAQLNHSANEDKASTSQVLQTAENGIYSLPICIMFGRWM